MVTINSLCVLLSQFGNSLLFHVCSNCCFLTCIQISQQAGKVVWFSHLLKNFPQFVVIHTVKGFGAVNKAEVDFFFFFKLYMLDFFFNLLLFWCFHFTIHSKFVGLIKVSPGKEITDISKNSSNKDKNLWGTFQKLSKWKTLMTELQITLCQMGSSNLLPTKELNCQVPPH